MFLEDIFSGFSFTSASTGGARVLQGGTEVDLSSIMKTSIQGGSSENSAADNMLGFMVELESYDATSIDLKFNFENPMYISLGEESDALNITFVKPELFVS